LLDFSLYLIDYNIYNNIRYLQKPHFYKNVKNTYRNIEKTVKHLTKEKKSDSTMLTKLTFCLLDPIL
jgi:hypothetical protein